MTSAIHVQHTIRKDGEVTMTGLPYRKGQRVDLFVRVASSPGRRRLTARRLLHSGLVGIWANRRDIKSSSAFARKLRRQAEQRDLR
jgi:hypothetical protein